MQRINGPGATPSNMFTEGDPVAGVAPTTVTDDWANAVQEEIAGVIEGSGRALDPTDNSQLLDSIVGFSGRFRNVIQNGSFRYWQRHKSGVTSNGASTEFAADRWAFQAGGGTAASNNARLGAVFGDFSIPSRPRFVLSWFQSVATAQTENPFIRQRIENVETLADGKATLSFYARLTVGSTTLTPVLRQRFGSGGGASADVVVSGTAISVTGTWARYSQTFDLPTTAGKSLGTGDDYLELKIEAEQGQVFTMQMGAVQLEFGQVASAFEVRDDNIELSLCQRFYETSISPDSNDRPLAASQSGIRTIWQGNAAVELYGLLERFQAQKVKVPTVTWHRPQDGVADTVDHPLNTSAAVVSGSSFVDEGSTGYPKLTSAATAGQLVRAYWSADAELT